MNIHARTPAEIAAAVGCSQVTVRRYLAERFAGHHRNTWWRLEDYQYQAVVSELRRGRCCSVKQPRRYAHRARALEQF